MSDTSLCEVSDLLVLVLLCLCRIIRHARYLNSYWLYYDVLFRMMFMSDTSLCEVSDLLVLVLLCHMSGTSPCEVFDCLYYDALFRILRRANEVSEVLISVL